MTLEELAQAKRRLTRHFEACDALWAAYEHACDEAVKTWIGGGSRRRGLVYPPRPRSPPVPDELVGLPCGARTRAGTPCKRRDLLSNGRCKLHGGLSTGPKTHNGKKRALRNLQMRWKPMRP